jgi:acyl-CoA thioesterase FadM
VVLNEDGMDLAASGTITPIKSMAFTFHRTLKPDDLFDMTVHVGAIRDRTLDLLIEATGMDGLERFSARLTPILVSSRSFESTAIPLPARQAFEGYRARFPAKLDVQSGR